MDQQKEKILVIQTAFLGDVILTLPLIQSLKKIKPNTEIDFLCIPDTANVLENHPSINRVIKYDKMGKQKTEKFFDVLLHLRDYKYDYILCPHRSVRSALLTYFSKASNRIGFDRNALSFLLTNKIPYIKNEHEINRNLEFIKAIQSLDKNYEKILQKPNLYPSESDFKFTEKLINESGVSGNTVSFAPCSKWFTKQLTINKSIEVISELTRNHLNVILIGGAEDFEFCREAERNTNSRQLKNFCGRLTPLQSYLMIKSTSVLITVDSAAQHLGAASGVPIILIYSSTDSSFGFYPLTSEFEIIQNEKLTCRPCTDHGRKKCPLGHFNCINELSASEITEKTLKLINKKKT